MNYYLADVFQNPVINNSAATNAAISAGVAATWENNWKNFFTGPIFTAIVLPCSAIAFVFFVISTGLTVYQWSQDGNDKHFFRLLTPLTILILLLNGGSMTRDLVMGLRGVSNAMDNTFLTTLQFDQNVNLRQQNLVGEQQVLQAIKRQGDQCKTERQPASAKACLVEMEKLIVEAQNSGKVLDSGAIKGLKDMADGITALTSGTQTTTQVAGALEIVALISNPLGAIASKAIMGTVETVVFLLMNLVTGAVQAMAEASFLLTALISPMFIAAALLPNGTKSLIALFTAFWSIINYKFCYIIIVGLSAQIAIDDGTTGSLILSIVTAIFAPVLAGILAGGAGMGFAKAAASATGQAVGSAASIAVKVSSGGAI